jgi:hypothetical protein
LQQSKAALGILTTVLATGLLAADEPADGVRLNLEWLARPVSSAVSGAARRLAEPRCVALLDEFRDAGGAPLRRRLDGLRLDAASYLRLLLFYDGSNEPPCRRRRLLLAYTAPGFRFVRVCPPLATLGRSDPREAQFVVIHELLHTLGLAENPPSHEEITARVRSRCQDPGRAPDTVAGRPGPL